MSNFKIGQRVACITEGWNNDVCPEDNRGPALEEVVTIAGFSESEYGEMLYLEEYSYYEDGTTSRYLSTAFRPLDLAFAEEILRAVGTPLEVGV